MGKYNKVLEKVIFGRSDTNVTFSELKQLLLLLGFQERIRGDHHIFSKEGVVEIINLQPLGAMAKPYQVKQVRQIIVRYRLELKND
ncbi:hypothetical protein MGMO_8c00660 [Methyloglobulus morosus KoM1]|uniref:YcfA family protein n=1 Tax=Methyloglobulus morosus KoM1 TaxID=1116472 RepID=V5C1E6_9GAMM|nr:hypothetical protein [Methyloglobulus morosus]ESS73929.1 hypothetical protein MGMO_8c00660 [Methyloglobulus morosus KoM1]